MLNDISAMRQGQTLPYAVCTFRDTNGNIVPMISGSAYTLYIYNPATNEAIQGTGTFDTTNETSGVVAYHWSTTDTANTGTFEVFVGYVPPGGGQGYTQPVEWIVLPLFGQQ